MKFKDILQETQDQVLKGLILKVKNESMKKDMLWSELRSFLKDLKDYDQEVFKKVLSLITEKKYK
ncbi:hypothetical protein HN460_02685 [bacterium]|jgi:hypothetical protein|nr:hypothetical protein [bacterium]MBT3795581.1 hypothetical protein [bacterium]MBT4634074.1 hypothetical protein [bacterium]